MRDNSYYPIKLNISLDIVSDNIVIFSKKCVKLDQFDETYKFAIQKHD